MTNERKIEVFNLLIDDMCDTKGVKETISYLLDTGCTYVDLLELHFTKEDIESVFQWKKYIEYLSSWAEIHSGYEYASMSPARFNEWVQHLMNGHNVSTQKKE